MKKIILPGLLAGFVMLAVSMLTGPFWNVVSPSLQLEYQNPGLFRPWSDPFMQLFFLHPFILGLLLAWVWDAVKSSVKAHGYQKGLLFGFSFWLVSSIPGMFVSFSTFPISLAMIVSWTVTGLLQALCAGLVFSKLNK